MIGLVVSERFRNIKLPNLLAVKNYGFMLPLQVLLTLIFCAFSNEIFHLLSIFIKV